MALKQTKTSNGIEIFFSESISESKCDPIIVLPGGPGLSSQIYQRYLKDLSPQSQIIFWDYASTGRSTSRPTNSFAQDYGDLKEVIKTLELKGFSLMAHSYGGSLAIKMASENPSLVKKLCLIATSDYFLPVLTDMAERKANRLSPEDFGKLNKIYERLMKNSLNPDDLTRLCELEAQNQFLKVTPEQTELFVTDSGLNPTVLGTNQDWIPLNFQSELSKITSKTLVVYSKKDIVVPPQFSQNLIDKIPKAQFKEFNSSGHWPFIEERKRFLDVVGDFFV